MIILLFIFSAEILGEVNAFYIRIPFWDTMLHTIYDFEKKVNAKLSRVPLNYYDTHAYLYMQDGDILEAGGHNELMEKGGLYAKLYNSQFAENKGRNKLLLLAAWM